MLSVISDEPEERCHMLPINSTSCVPNSVFQVFIEVILFLASHRCNLVTKIHFNIRSSQDYKGMCSIHLLKQIHINVNAEPT